MGRLRRYEPLGPAKPGSVGHYRTARDTFTGELCVLKTAPTGSPGAAVLAEEATLLATLRHPNIVQFAARIEHHPSLDEGGGPISGLATCWQDAELLDVWASQHDLSQKLQAAADLCAAIDYLHRRGVLHLDLKPANVLCADGKITLLDFGTAQRVQATFRQAGGTLGYASPEVLNRISASTESDVFSLGAIFYALFAGRPAFDPAKVTRENFSHQSLVPIRALNSAVPKPIANMIKRMLSVSPANRPSLREAQQALGVPNRRKISVGLPPFVGREAQVHELVELIAHQSQPISVIGERGSGRTRLARAALTQRVQTDDVLDLSALPDPSRALDQLCESMPRIDSKVIVLLPRKESLSEEVVNQIIGRLPLLTCADVGVLWPMNESAAIGPNFLVGPLEAHHLEQLAQFCSATTGTDNAQAFIASNGLPGPFLRLLNRPTDQSEDTPESRLLRALPQGIPQALLHRLGPNFLATAQQLVSDNAARFTNIQHLVVYETSKRFIPDSHVPIIQDFIDSDAGKENSPLWCALMHCRLDTPARAAQLFDFVPLDHHQSAAFKDLCTALSDTHHAPAIRKLAALELDDGDFQHCLTLLERIKKPLLEDWLLRLHALRVAERIDDAKHLITTYPTRPLPGALILEAARMAIGESDYQAANEILTTLTAADHIENAAVELGVRVQIAANLAMREGRPIPTSLVEEVLQQRDDPNLPSFAIGACARAAEGAGDVDVAMELYAQRIQRADLMRNLRDATSARLNLSNAYARSGRGESGRTLLIEALQGARKLDNLRLLLRVLFGLVELELHSHRLPAADRYMTAFRKAAARAPSPDVHVRGVFLEAIRFELLGDAEAVLKVVEPLLTRAGEQSVERTFALFAARAHHKLGNHQRALDLIDLVGPPRQAFDQREVHLLRGRALVALGRQSLQKARQGLPLQPDASTRETTGRILLGAAGEDLDPESFADRRADLTDAIRLLSGERASQAVALRDRLLEGPGAGLGSMVDVIESMHAPASFPQALANLVAEALGANRVLIMVRIPGLGRQVTCKELTDGEAAGVSVEVLKRLQKPDDVWLSADAFADPHLRQVSATVRTFEIRSVLAVSIPLNGVAIGALYVDDKHRAGRFTDEDVTVLKRLARVAGRMIPLMRQNPAPRLSAPRDVLGVLDTNPRRVAELELTVDRLRHEKQTNLLITGATGTGKTWLARRIATDLLGLRGLEEATMRQTDVDRLVGMLAGTRPGDFTGAIANDGLIHTCLREKRVLFLDEIQALDDDAQVALLPLLELPKRRFGGLTGSAGQLRGHLTIVLCTNVNVADGGWRAHFREDFWFRISQAHIDLAPIRERGEEAFYSYLQRFLAERDAPSPSAVLKPDALGALSKMAWTGNLRELSRVAHDLAYHWSQLQRSISLAELLAWRVVQPDESGRITIDTPAAVKMTPFLQEVLALLPRFGWNQSSVARQMGTTVSRVNRSLKRAGLLAEVGRQRVENQHQAQGPHSP